MKTQQEISAIALEIAQNLDSSFYEVVKGHYLCQNENTLKPPYKDEEDAFNLIVADIIADCVSSCIDDSGYLNEDSLHEWADSQVDIYYHDIYNSTRLFADAINEARGEGLLQGDETIDKQIQSGQYHFYYRLGFEVKDKWEDLNSL